MSRIIIILLFFASVLNAQNKHIKIPIPVVAGSGGGTGTVTSISATAPTEGFTVSGSPITSSGTFVFTLSHDLNGLESLSGTGFAIRTADNTWSLKPFTSVDTSFTNEIQVLSLAGSTLSLSNGGGSVVLPGGGGGSQTLDTFEIVSNILRASLSGDGQPYKSVSLANYLQTLSFNSGTGQLTISNGNTVTITAGGGSSTDLAFSTGSGGIFLQSSSGGDVFWSAGTGISITQSGGLTATITNTAPHVNQTLSILGTTLTISGGNSVTIPGGTVAGSGSTNFVPIWTGANSLGNSILLYNGVNSFNLGTGAAGAYKLYFGDQQFVFVGEGSTDDRLHLRGSTMSVEIGTNNFGANGQALVSNGTTLSYTTVDLSNTNELQTISLVGNVLTLSNGGGSVSLPSGGGGTITDLSVTQSGANAILNSSDGLDVTLVSGSGVGLTVNTSSQMTISFTEVDGSITNEAQTLSRAGNNITLSTAGGAGGGTVSVSDLVNITYTGGTGISVSGSTITNTGDLSSTNELQTFSTSGLIASLSGGVSSSIGMASGSGITITNSGTPTNPVFTITNTSTNTDNQSLTLTGQSLGISGGGSGVTLPVINVSAGSGISVSASSGNYTITNTSLNTDNQTLSWSGITTSGATLNVSSGNSVQILANTAGIQLGNSGGNIVINNVGDLSNSNELQNLSVSGNAISISSGTGANMWTMVNTGSNYSVPGGAANGTIIHISSNSTITVSGGVFQYTTISGSTLSGNFLGTSFTMNSNSSAILVLNAGIWNVHF